MKVKDTNGNVIHGIERTDGGGLSVNNSAEYTKYMHERQSALKIMHLQEEIESLKNMVKTLIEKNNG